MSASVCHRHVHGEMGGATVWMVRLPDGFLLDCGSGFFSEPRAHVLANSINAGDATVLSAEGLQNAVDRGNWS